MMICPDLNGKRKKSVKSLEDFVVSTVLEDEPEMVVKSFKVRGKEYGTARALDYESLDFDVVGPELLKRAAWRTWRSFPCKKIANVLPPGFATWSHYLEKGGVVDKSTGRGSLTRAQKRFFWSDQCACKCWAPPITVTNSTLTPIRHVRDDHVEISYLETIDAARESLQKKKEDERSMVNRVDTFFKDLETQYVLNGNRNTGDAQDMIDWYWDFPLKREFLCAYEQRWQKLN